MTDAPGIVVIGAGQAGLQAAESLRSGGYAGAITMLGDEKHGPYHRPPLSKAWLAGEIEADQLVMRAPELLARMERTRLKRWPRKRSRDQRGRFVSAKSALASYIDRNGLFSAFFVIVFLVVCDRRWPL